MVVVENARFKEVSAGAWRSYCIAEWSSRNWWEFQIRSDKGSVLLTT